MAQNHTWRDRIYRSPALKTAISVLISLFIGIFSNTLVTEITTDAGISWDSMPRKFSFWALIISSLAAFQFHRHLHIYETEISAFKDVDFCMAYARSQLIPAQVSASITAIAAGDDAQFKAAMKKIKDALK